MKDDWWKGNELREKFNREWEIRERNLPREVRKGWEKEMVLVTD